MLKRLKNWLIKLLGGYTPDDRKASLELLGKLEEKIKKQNAAVDFWFNRAKNIHGEKEAILDNLVTAEAEIPLGGAMRYNADNVVNESRQQVYYQLGKAVYPFAHHFITETKYICAVNVQGKEE